MNAEIHGDLNLIYHVGTFRTLNSGVTFSNIKIALLHYFRLVFGLLGIGDPQETIGILDTSGLFRDYCPIHARYLSDKSAKFFCQ